MANVGPTKESEATRDAVSSELDEILQTRYGESCALIEFQNLTNT